MLFTIHIAQDNISIEAMPLKILLCFRFCILKKSLFGSLFHYKVVFCKSSLNLPSLLQLSLGSQDLL